MDPGLKGCQYLLGRLPSWISLTDREKMEWLNRLLEEMWPYYDRGICQVVKDTVEPIMEQYKPPGVIKKIYFSELTFGDAPFRIEGITVKEDPDAIDMEVDVRWSGDANISLAIDLPLPGNLVRVHPKVKDIVFVATIKILLKPMVEAIPGFAAAAVALKSEPIIKYRLDFGVLPAAVTTVITSPIINFIEMMVNTVAVPMLLWPNRITVPLLSWDGVMPANDEDIDIEVERLSGRPQGIIKVHVISAKGLKSFDTLTGKSDPFVELSTITDEVLTTKVIKNNLSPVWNEVKYLPVLEKDQSLRLEMFDYDAINVAEGLTLKVWKSVGQMVGAKDFMARAAIPLAEFIRQEGMEEELWFPLGRGEWTLIEGPGKGDGMIRLGLEYKSIQTIGNMSLRHAKEGLLLVTVIRIRNLVGTNKGEASSKVYLKLGKEVRETTPIRMNNNPRWSNGNKFTFYDVDISKTSTIEIEVNALPEGLAAIGLKESLGETTVYMADIVDSRQVSRWTKAEQTGYLRKWYDLANGDGSAIELEFEFLPYWH